MKDEDTRESDLIFFWIIDNYHYFLEIFLSSLLIFSNCVHLCLDVEGRAGMAAICSSEKRVDFNYLLGELSKVLPAYAIPQFIRICDKLESTGEESFLSMFLFFLKYSQTRLLSRGKIKNSKGNT